MLSKICVTCWARALAKVTSLWFSKVKNTPQILVLYCLIILDSLYRQSSTEYDNTSITDYVCDLSDQLRNVLSLRLYSYQIPNSWYLIDVSYGNSCFWIYNNFIWDIYSFNNCLLIIKIKWKKKFFLE